MGNNAKKPRKRRSEEEIIVSELNLMDDFLFSAVMEHKEACEFLISALLGIKVTVLEQKTQFSIRNIENHSIIYDVLVKDIYGKLYDVEINTGSGGCPEKRVRYYTSAIDWAFFDKGGDYKDIPEMYLLYITEEDPFKFGSNHYEVEQSLGKYSRNRKSKKKYDNGVHVHYFNLEVKDKDNRELTALLQYLGKSDPNNTKFGALSEKVYYYKVHEEGVRYMCKQLEEYVIKERNKGEIKGRAEGLAEGKAEGKLESKIEMVTNMLNLGYKKSEALKCAGIDAKTYNKYLAKQ